MKTNLIIITVVSILSGYLVYKYFPKTVTKNVPDIRTEVRDKIVTVIKTLPGNIIEKTITEDRVILQEKNIIPLPKQYMVGITKTYNGSCGLYAGRRVFGDLFAIVGATTEKQVNIGVYYEF